MKKRFAKVSSGFHLRLFIKLFFVHFSLLVILKYYINIKIDLKYLNLLNSLGMGAKRPPDFQNSPKNYLTTIPSD